MENKVLLYHGSQEIVEFPEIRLQKYNKDFYFGFYCTNIDGSGSMVFFPRWY